MVRDYSMEAIKARLDAKGTRRRDINWKKGFPYTYHATDEYHRSALVDYYEGVEVPQEARCTCCARGGGVMKECVVSLDEHGGYKYKACSNCRWYHQPTSCSFREVKPCTLLRLNGDALGELATACQVTCKNACVDDLDADDEIAAAQSAQPVIVGLALTTPTTAPDAGSSSAGNSSAGNSSVGAASTPAVAATAPAAATTSAAVAPTPAPAPSAPAQTPAAASSAPAPARPPVITSLAAAFTPINAPARASGASAGATASLFSAPTGAPPANTTVPYSFTPINLPRPTPGAPIPVLDPATGTIYTVPLAQNIPPCPGHHSPAWWPTTYTLRSLGIPGMLNSAAIGLPLDAESIRDFLRRGFGGILGGGTPVVPSNVPAWFASAHAAAIAPRPPRRRARGRGSGRGRGSAPPGPPTHDCASGCSCFAPRPRLAAPAVEPQPAVQPVPSLSATAAAALQLATVSEEDNTEAQDEAMTDDNAPPAAAEEQESGDVARTADEIERLNLDVLTRAAEHVESGDSMDVSDN